MPRQIRRGLLRSKRYDQSQARSRDRVGFNFLPGRPAIGVRDALSNSSFQFDPLLISDWRLRVFFCDALPYRFSYRKSVFLAQSVKASSCSDGGMRIL